MYTRNYFGEGEERISPPEKYGGIAFSPPSEKEESEPVSLSSEEKNQNPWEGMPKVEGKKKESGSILSSLTKAPLLGGVLEGIPFLSELKIPKIGTEELIIIGTALFLFFSKEGDRECALILLLLLLIN